MKRGSMFAADGPSASLIKFVIADEVNGAGLERISVAAIQETKTIDCGENCHGPKFLEKATWSFAIWPTGGFTSAKCLQAGLAGW